MLLEKQRGKTTRHKNSKQKRPRPPRESSSLARPLTEVKAKKLEDKGLRQKGQK